MYIDYPEKNTQLYLLLVIGHLKYHEIPWGIKVPEEHSAHYFPLMETTPYI